MERLFKTGDDLTEEGMNKVVGKREPAVGADPFCAPAPWNPPLHALALDKDNLCWRARIEDGAVPRKLFTQDFQRLLV